MEVYIAPPEGSDDAALTRARVLAALTQAGLTVATTDERAGTGQIRALWILGFQSTDASLQFQETASGLVFATLEHSMLDKSGCPDRICGALEALGWEVDQQNVG